MLPLTGLSEQANPALGNAPKLKIFAIDIISFLIIVSPKRDRRQVMGKDSSTVSMPDFLKFAGKTAAVSASFLSGCAQTSSQSAGRSAGGPARAIDIHHHYFAPELVNEIKQHGNALGIEYYAPKDSRESPLSIQFPKGNRLNLDPRLGEIEKRLEIMNQGSIAIATVEVQTSAVGYELDGSRGESLVQAL